MKSKSKKPRKPYAILETSPFDFFVSDNVATYGLQKPYEIYYENQEPFVKLLKGDCVEVLNQARECSVDMIFADPPYFLSNGVAA